MKKLNIILSLTIMFLAYGELINMNPDRNGEPWWAGGWKMPDTGEMERINALPKLTLPDSYKNKSKELPYTLDNSTQSFFRPIFSQQGGSCAQASGVGYNFTYEMNSINGTSADEEPNQFPTHYTYNFLNEGDGGIGSTYFGGWDIINAGGIPNVPTYGGMWPSTDPDTMFKIWMNGFDKYKTGMDKRIIEVISIPVNTPEGLETLKQYFNDYCNGSPSGGIVNFAAGVSYTFSMGSLPVETENQGQLMVLNWDQNVNHAMTFIGYNDSVRWDFNTDGKYTNDIDITGDDIVDMRDWEIRGLLMANSWGTGWANGGKAWVAYRTLALSLEDGGIWTNTVHTIRIRDDFSPNLYLKTTINFSDRKELKIYAGVSSDTAAVAPEYTISYPHFNHQGGADIGMAGDSNILELGLDISPLLSYVETGKKSKFFLCVEHKEDGAAGRGSVTSFSVIDGSGNEYISPQTNVSIVKNSTVYLGVKAVIDFNAPQIIDVVLPTAEAGIPYSHTLTAQNGIEPYRWDIIFDYNETENPNEFPTNTENQLIVTNDDDGFSIIDLDFQFPFFGGLYDKVTVITDGSILFGNQFEYVRSEGDILAFKTITVYGADLMAYPEDGDGIYYSMDSECLTVRWITSMWGQRYVNLDFACKIYANSNIEFYYGDNLTTGISWASGISNGKVIDAVITSISNVTDPSGLKTGFATTDYPYGIELSSDGVFGGTTTEINKTWNVNFRVTDDQNISCLKELIFTTSTGIEYNGDTAISDFELMQNYPNPFNPATRISFNLKNNQTMSLKVYNSTGETVDTILNNKLLNSGKYSYDWTASEKLSSGTYYFGLESKTGVKQIRKMTILK
ncbi:MAG: T9SS type A sorting domain-containing protein [Candidatus Delongbacteria bacterium]|nr:T9SS type A sorting domain-containing protein [Candidatus Delongbacteria bacterium]MCG2761037.1 T9SS type A sorting domain-containing protein [Candidatus Delongbacteria bacterium]